MIPPDGLRDGARGLFLLRAWPRPHGEILAEYGSTDGDRVAARWLPDAARGTDERERTPGSRAADDPRVVLLPHGADHRLSGVARDLARGGTLMSHRPGRRAVVRTADGTYRKHVRRGRGPDLARRHELLGQALGDACSAPAVMRVTNDIVELSALPGHPLIGEPRDGGRPILLPEASAWRAIGRALALLASHPGEDGLPLHDAAAEARVTSEWLARAVAAGRLPPIEAGPLLEPLLRGPQVPAALSHRDLHDGQILVDGDAVGILDADTLARAESALDLANLLVHLELRVLQGVLSESGRDLAARAIIDSMRPPGPVLQRLPAYLRSTRLRLAAVHAFRPRWRPIVGQLLASAGASHR